MICYIQIYDEQFFCKNGGDIKKKIFITPETRYLKETGTNYDTFPLTFISIVDTFETDFNDIIKVFKHSKDTILDGWISDGILYIIGDNDEILYDKMINVDYSVERTPIILKANSSFLKQNHLQLF